MTLYECNEPECHIDDGVVSQVIEPRERDLGEFTVRRVLPAARQRSVGPFVFFDHMGPAQFPPGRGIAVRPHPHIGLATITYLFEGEILHRDSLGFVQPIRPGAVNLMTAGRGIVHSERAGDDLDVDSRLHGIQSWLALPLDKEEVEPSFEHVPADALPEFDVGGTVIRLIMGSCHGATSPVVAHSKTLYLEAHMNKGGGLDLPPDQEELALYVVSGCITVGGRDFHAGQMPVIRKGHAPSLVAIEASHVMVIGGAPLGERHMVWNFVSSSRARIEQAKDDWREGRFDPVPGDDEFIPLPD